MYKGVVSSITGYLNKQKYIFNVFPLKETGDTVHSLCKNVFQSSDEINVNLSESNEGHNLVTLYNMVHKNISSY